MFLLHSIIKLWIVAYISIFYSKYLHPFHVKQHFSGEAECLKKINLPIKTSSQKYYTLYNSAEDVISLGIPGLPELNVVVMSNAKLKTLPCNLKQQR